MSDEPASNVVGIPGLAYCAPPGQPNAEVIDLLAKYLDEAKRGGFVQVFVAAIEPSRSIRTIWAGQASSHDGLAAVTVLRLRVEKAYMEGIEDA